VVINRLKTGGAPPRSLPVVSGWVGGFFLVLGMHRSDANATIGNFLHRRRSLSATHLHTADA